MKKPEGNTHKNGKVFSVYSLINHFTLKHVRTYVHTYIHTYIINKWNLKSLSSHADSEIVHPSISKESR